MFLRLKIFFESMRRSQFLSNYTPTQLKTSAQRFFLRFWKKIRLKSKKNFLDPQNHPPPQIVTIGGEVGVEISTCHSDAFWPLLSKSYDARQKGGPALDFSGKKKTVFSVSGRLGGRECVRSNLTIFSLIYFFLNWF